MIFELRYGICIAFLRASDGVGGTETQVGPAPNEAACVTMVQDAYPAGGAEVPNGATFNGEADGEGICYAEFGMTGRNDSPSWQTCTFVPDFCT